MHWTHEQIMEMAEAAVFSRWLAGEQPQTIAEIASEIGVSESTLRTHACGGAPKGCRTTTVDRWVPSEAGLRARFASMVERMRAETELSPRDRAEMEARG